MTEFIDISRNNIFLNTDEKKAINTDLNTFFSLIRNYLCREQLKINLYLSGSLARREPSIFYVDDKIQLFSDIDFFLISDSESEKKIYRFEEWLKNIRPDINSTLQIIQLKNVNYLEACSAYDFISMINEPIYLGFVLEDLNLKPLNKRHLMENIIHQFSGYFLYPPKDENKDNFFRDHDYHLYKLILEMLRAQLVDSSDIGKGYYEVYEQRESSSISFLLPPNKILNVLRAREIFGSVSSSSIDTIDLLQKSLLIHLGLSSSYNFSELTLKILKLENELKKDVIDNYIFFSILYIFMISKRDDELLELNKIFVRVAKNIVKQNWFTSDLKSLTDEEFMVSNIKNKEFHTIHQIFRFFHRKYLRVLTLRNLGYKHLVQKQ